MSYYYIVGQALTDEGITANVPDGTSWVGQPLTDGTYLVKTEVLLPSSYVIQRVLYDDLTTAWCSARGLIASEVKSIWGVKS